MAQSESTKQTHALDKILPAILAVQSSVEPIKKDTDNTFFKSKYADLASIWHDIKGHMMEQDLVVIHAASRTEDGKDSLITRIYHSPSGQYIESVCPIDPVKKDPQGYGAAMTYMRRYAISGLLGIVTEADDDGNEASQADKKVKPQKKDPDPLPEFVKPFDEVDFNILQDRLQQAKTLDEIELIASDARSAYKRMKGTRFEKDVSNAINSRKLQVANLD